MFDYVCVFTTGGVLLWSKTIVPDFNLDMINIFIKASLLDYSRTSAKSFCHKDSLLKWQINQDLKLVFAVVYKEILQLAFVEEFLDLLSKAFIGGVYEKFSLAGCDDAFLKIGGVDCFSQHYEIVYTKWDAIVENKQKAPTRMRTFAESSKKGSKKGKVPKDKAPAPLLSDGSDGSPGTAGPTTPGSGRRRQGGGKPRTPRSGKKGPGFENEEPEESKKEIK